MEIASLLLHLSSETMFISQLISYSPNFDKCNQCITQPPPQVQSEVHLRATRMHEQLGGSLWRMMVKNKSFWQLTVKFSEWRLYTNLKQKFDYKF